jgi:ABC-2 type transport system permease protein
MATIAKFLPTYHLAQLGLAQLGSGTAMIHVLVLVITTVVAGGVAALSYRHARI